MTPFYFYFFLEKCSLYSNSIEDDKLAMYDAGVKALEVCKTVDKH